MPIKIHLPPDVGDQIDKFFVAQQVGADLRDPRQLRTGRDDVAQQRLQSFLVDREIVVDEEDGDLAALAFRHVPLSRSSSSTTLSFVRKRIESPKNPVTVQNSQPYGQPRPGLDRDDEKFAPTRAQFRHQRPQKFRDQVELFQIERFPRNMRIRLQARLFVVALFVDSG